MTERLTRAGRLGGLLHFHVFVWHRHDGWHRPRGRYTGGWHGHLLFHHEHGPEGAKSRRFYWHNQHGWTRLGPIGWAQRGRTITIGVGRWGKTWNREVVR